MKWTPGVSNLLNNCRQAVQYDYPSKLYQLAKVTFDFSFVSYPTDEGVFNAFLSFKLAKKGMHISKCFIQIHQN